MLKKPPRDFRTFIEFYDYVHKTNPELLQVFGRNRSVIYRTSRIENGHMKHMSYRISVQSLQAECWKEIQSHRLTENDYSGFRMNDSISLLKANYLLIKTIMK